MPQMSPISWILIYFVLMLILLMNLSNSPKLQNVSIKKIKLNKKELFIKW